MAASSEVKKYTPGAFDMLYDNSLVNSHLFNVRKSSYSPSDRYIHLFYDSKKQVSCLSVFPSMNKSGSKMAIVFFHGNSCDLGDCVGRMAIYGYWFKQVIIGVEYPGYGCCQGTTDQSSVIQKSIDTIQYIQNTLDIPLERVILFGHSIGCAIALKINSIFNGIFAAVIIQSPFFNVKKMASSSIFSFMFSEESVFNNGNEVENMMSHQRLLIIHGAKDEIIPLDHSKQLFERCKLPKSQKQFFIDTFASHNVFDKIKLRLEILHPFICECEQVYYDSKKDSLIRIETHKLCALVDNIPSLKKICDDSYMRVLKCPTRRQDNVVWVGADGNCCFSTIDEVSLYHMHGQGDDDYNMLTLSAKSLLK
jgi:predicted esterase